MTDHHKPLVSVVMPVYNTEKYLAEAIESILAQTFSDFELIIVDDASHDSSPAISRAFAEADCRIRVIELAENGGHGAARNVGLAAASGEYFACQDSDDISLPERFQKQVKLLQARPEVGAVGVYTRLVSEDMQPIYERKPPVRHAEIMLDHFLGFLSSPFTHATLMMRRHLVMEVNGFDESVRISPDCALLTKLLGRAKFANIAEFLYLYRQHSSQITAERHTERERETMLVRQVRLERIWGEAPLETVERLARVRPWSRISWRERRAAKRDIKRLIEAMIAAEWIEPGDRPHLIEAMNRRLERVSPRLWQKFSHWRRHHFGENGALA